MELQDAGTGCRVLIGVDVKKDRKVLEAAYDDSSGITAAFNLNMLRHLNATVGSDFDLTDSNMSHTITPSLAVYRCT